MNYFRDDLLLVRVYDVFMIKFYKSTDNKRINTTVVTLLSKL